MNRAFKLLGLEFSRLPVVFEEVWKRSINGLETAVYPDEPNYIDLNKHEDVQGDPEVVQGNAEVVQGDPEIVQGDPEDLDNAVLGNNDDEQDTFFVNIGKIKQLNNA